MAEASGDKVKTRKPEISRPMSDPDRQWIDRIKETMAVDVSRFSKAGMTGREVVDRIFDIPEVSQAFNLRANRRRPLAMDPTTPEQKLEIAEALERIAAWLDDGFHTKLVEELREIAAEMDR